MAVTQKEIAEHLNVSAPTVSRSLRNDPSISAALRGRVLDTASRLGYFSGSGRRRMDATRGQGSHGQADATTTMGVLVKYEQGRVNDIHERMLAGLSDAAGALDAALMTHYVRPEQLPTLLDKSHAPAMFRRPDLDGIVLLNHYPREIVAELSQRWPCASVTFAYHDLPVDAVEVDPIAGMVQLVEHLRARGYERIGFIRSAMGQGWSHARFAGYAEALSRLGLPLEPANVIDTSGSASPEHMQAFADRLRAGVNAWMGASDMLAHHFANDLAQAHGLRAGRDYALTGFDYRTMAPAQPRRLTTIEAPFEHMGGAALRRLRDRLDLPADPPRAILLRGRLIEGDTTPPAHSLV